MKKSLASELPKLAKEWDYKANGELRPNEVPPKGRARVYWKCKKGHSWPAKLASRANGTGCPYCNGSKVTFERSLAAKRPDLLSMWDYDKNKVTPDQVLAGSGTDAFWICAQGHSFPAPPKQLARNRKSRGCPYCRGLRVNGQNSLAALYPSIAREWVKCINNDSITPNDVTPGCSSKKVLWTCNRGHEWPATPKSRAIEGTGCPKCNQAKKVSKRSYILYFYLKKHFKDVKMEVPLKGTRMTLDIYIPCINLFIEYDGGIYHKSSNRDINKDKKLLEKKSKDKIIRIREPECPTYRSPNPNTIFYKLNTHSNKEFQVCLEKIFKKHFNINYNINIAKDNIYILELMDQFEYENSLAALKPELIKEWDYKLNGNLKPEFFKVTSHEEVKWLCNKGHRWPATIASRTYGGNNCPDCGHRRLNNENNLASVNPKLTKEWHPIKNNKRPNEYFANAHFKVWWLCNLCGHEWRAFIYHRNGNGSGCPNCCK